MRPCVSVCVRVIQLLALHLFSVPRCSPLCPTFPHQCGMQAISNARKKFFNSRYTCPVEVNGHICGDLSPPVVRKGRSMHLGSGQVETIPLIPSHSLHVKSPSSVGNGAESQSEIASSDFGFEILDFPDSVIKRHASFDEKLFELRRQAPDQIAVSCE